MRNVSSTITKLLAIALSTSWTGLGFAEEIMPAAEGTSWKYRLTEEAGEGFRLSNAKSDQEGKIREPVLYRIRGTKDVDGKKLLEFEMHRGGRLTNTDLMTVDEHGIQCWARVDESGATTKLDPPQTIVASPLGAATRWDFDGEISGDKVHQHYQIAGEESVDVPAGKFRAVHIHGEQTTPGRMIVDRWFVPGTGIIKDVTETQSETHELLRRISLELSDGPKNLPRPEIKPQTPGNKLTATVGTEAIGESRTNFRTSTPKIYARWQGHELRYQAKIRVLWIAEEVPDVAPPDYTIDEATTTATAADSRGVFALARPAEGWAPGTYRVEFYIDGNFIDAVKLKIEK